ncbi:MAG: sensor histidine kinase [Saccharofermentanales bacterium]
MKFKLKTKLSMTIAFVALLTVFLISVFSNVFVNRQFKGYKISQSVQNAREIINSLSLQYSQSTKTWDADFVHTIGMQALSDGYILKLKDNSGKVIWDAETCDMTSCLQLVSRMTLEMKERSPGMNGKFISTAHEVTVNQVKIGELEIKSFSPYYLSESDLIFVKGLNTILLGIGAISLMISILIGIWFARRLSDPILKTIAVTKQIAGGNYSANISDKTNTLEVLELMESVNMLAESLDKQETIRKQLTADVAHELRTPLTTLQTHIEAMLEGVWEPTPERLQSCHDEVIRLSRMVSDLDSLAKVESGNMALNLEKINLYDIAKSVVLGFETQIVDKMLDVSIEGKHPDIYADKDRIHQVLVNLLSNAIKYTPDRGRIAIKLSETNENIIFSIKDNGIGISESDLPYIFERFYRADKSRNRMTGGSGIGLAIVKSIITAHGGKVSVKSGLNEGSEFILEFPR